MAKSVKLRQGTDTEHAAFTGEMAEVTFDTTNNTIILHDGTTPGGIPMAKLSDVPVDLTDLTDVDGNLVGSGISFSGTTYTVTVASGTNAYSTGNKYYITDLADASPTVTLTEGVTYRFDQSDSTNTGHPLKFSTTADGTHDSGIEYTTGVTYNGVPGQADAYTEITVEVGAPTLYYYCTNHSGMGDAPAPPPTPMWSLSGDSESFAAVSTSKLDTSAASYVALNNPTGWGNIWAMVDGSWVIRNNPTSLDGPGTRPLNIWSTDDLSEGMTYQFWIKFDANQPAMWEGLAGIKTDDPTTSYNYAHWQTSSNQLGWGANSVYGYYVHPGNNTVNQPSGEALSSYGWIHIAVELQSNGRIVHYFDGVPVINVSAGDVSTRTEKANFHFGSVNSCVTDIEVYTGGGIHNPDLLETPPGFTPSARKTADTSNASVSGNIMWSLSGDSESFAAVSTSKLDTSAASYVALNHPSGRGNAWALEDGSYALRNNSNLVNDPGTRPLHIWSTDDLSDGMTTQYWIKFDANQPGMWEALHSIEAGSSQAYSYSISLAYAVHTLAWAGNGAYGYFGHTSNGSSSFPDQGWLHIAEEIQSNGRQVIYINGVVVVNESASDLFGLTNKANLRIGSVSSWMTDIEVYTGGGIHNPDLLETPPGFTPPARKTAPIPIVTSSLVWHVDAANPSSYSGSGSTWSDLIGSEDVDLIGSPTYSADEGGGAFNFVAGSSYGKTSFTRTNDDFSVSAWYKPNDPQSSNQGYYNLMNTFESSSAEWWSLSLLGPSPRPFWVCDNDSAKIELWADGGTVNSTWQMITGTRSGNTMKIYVNGTLQGTSTALTSSAISGVEPIWIASRSNEDTGSPSETYGGWISDLKMYSKELSDSEVLQNYNALKDRYT